MEKILTNEELNHYFNLYSNGDLESRRILIVKNLRLIDYVLNRYINTNIYDITLSYEDLFNYGVIGLVKAVDTFDLSKNNSFSNYAIRLIYNHILLEIRRAKKDVQFDFSIYQEEFMNTLEFNEDYERILDKEYLRSYLIRLDKREQFVINNYYGIDCNALTLIEISKILNCSINLVHIIKNRALKKIRLNILNTKVKQMKY